MSIGTFLAVLAAVAIVNYLAFAFMSLRGGGGDAAIAGLSERTVAAVTIAIPAAIALAFRSLDFGVDTMTYYRFYQQYCLLGDRTFEFSYLVSFGMVNLASLGFCTPDLLAPVWVALIVLGFLILPIPWRSRFCLLALSLISIVGIEMLTNAFRQGLSASVLLLGAAWFERNRKVGVALLLASVVLHSSAALVLAALFLSTLRWRWYLAGLAVIAAAAINYEAFTFIGAVDRLAYEISKYSAHEAEDLWVRVIAAGQLALILVFAYLFRKKPADYAVQADGGAAEREGLSSATKLALTALPYLTLPYFGYRYIYGIYFVVLLLSRRTIMDQRSPAFEALLLANIILVLAWAFGSSVISSAPFLNL